MLKVILMDKFKNWMTESANILFDDSKNDLRALPKSVRLQILLVLSFIWTTVFSLYVFSYTTFAFGWAGLYIAHIGLIFAVYTTFKQFHRAEEKSASVFRTKNFDPFKIMAIFFVIVFMFVFSKGILISTIIAVFIEINNMYNTKSVTLADLLLMFLYLEVMAMVRVFWDEQSIRITLPLLIAITALSRFIIMQGKEMDPSALVYQSAAILLIAVAIVVMRLRHSKKLGIEAKSKKK